MIDNRCAPAPPARTTIDHIAVDLGKTTCRVRIEAGGAVRELVGRGAPGLASHEGAERAVEAIDAVLDGVSPTALDDVEAIGIGAAGGDSQDAGVRQIIDLIQARRGWDVVIASDVVTAHIGAFAGGSGTILVAGTGAVAGHVAHDGNWTRSDGWGPWLGDEGSGLWLGERGLVAALRSADGRGRRTALEADARAIAPDLLRLPHIMTGSPDVVRSIASFAPAVMRRSAEGDLVAGEIVRRAVDHLAATARSVAASGGHVCVVGGLTQDAGFHAALWAALISAGLEPRPPIGSALDGASALAVRQDLLHERYAVRNAALPKR